jgi:RNA polymerase primary sigma factor
MAAKDTDDIRTDDQDQDVSLNVSQASIKKMIAQAKERGYITYEQLNQALPPAQVSSEQIEDVMSMLSEMGINVVEDDEEADEGETKSTELVETSGSREVALSNAGGPEALDRCGCICAKWARSSCCRAKAKSPSPSGLKRGATR